jgi:hypothetical protein
MTSWLDSFVAVPTIGLQIAPALGAFFRFPELVSPILDEALREDTALQITQETGKGLSFRTERGFAYKLLVDQIIVEFSYSKSEEKLAGQAPSLKPLSVRPFSTLLAQCRAEMRKVLDLVSAQQQLKVHRFGVVASVNLPSDAAPPGVEAFLAHLGAFFPGKMLKADASFLTLISETDEGTERCHHAVSFDELAVEGDLTMRFDWQKTFGRPRAGGRLEYRPLDAALKGDLDGNVASAMAYFERLGRGELVDA